MVQIVLGTLYGFSALVKPLQEHFKDWSAKDVQWAFTLAILTFALVMVPAGRFQDRRGPRLPAQLGAVVLACGAALAMLVEPTHSKLVWWLSYGVLFGAGIGLAYVCPIAALAKWFPDIKGLITGVAVAGFGGGAAFFVPKVSAFLDPRVGGHTLSQFFAVHAGVCLVVVGIGASLLRNPPEGWTPPARAKAAATRPPVADLAWGQMLRTPRFWTLWLLFIASAAAGLMTIGVVKAAVEAVTVPLPVGAPVKVITASQAATAAVVLAICNALGRIFWGGVSEQLGRPRAMLINFTLQAATMFALYPCIQAAARASFAQMQAAAGTGILHPLPGWHPAALVACLFMALVGANFGGVLALFPSATADAFGTKNLGVNYGLVFTGYGIAGVVGPQIAAYYKDTLKVYDPAFLVAGVLVSLAVVGAALLPLTATTPKVEHAGGAPA